jgi:hypothetical protein
MIPRRARRTEALSAEPELALEADAAS